ncbi:MmcB family DNA repair protein [Roseivivax sp. CAU 1753]
MFMNCSYFDGMNVPDTPSLLPGQLLARGVSRHLIHAHGFACIEEFAPERGRRVDVMGLGGRGEIWVVECKSSRADFMSDGKWQGYLDWCDRYFWAVDQDFPTDLLPEETGLIIADPYDAEIVRMAPEHKLAGARRNALIRRFARHASLRLQAMRDPDAGLSAPSWS